MQTALLPAARAATRRPLAQRGEVGGDVPGIGRAHAHVRHAGVRLEGGRVLACDSPAALQGLTQGDTITIAAADPAAVKRTLRGQFDVEITETRDGVRYRAQGGESAAAGRTPRCTQAAA